MTAPLNLAALKALHEAATKGEWESADAYIVFGANDTPVAEVYECNDAEFIVAAHTHWLELLAIAAQRDRLIAITQKDFAEKAAMAERLEIATKHIKDNCTCHFEPCSVNCPSYKALAAIAAHEAERGKE